MSWKIKEKPEDFIVTEVIFDKTEESWKEKMQRIRGHSPKKKEKYLWFTLKKADKDFFQVIGRLGRELKISTKEIGYSGTKDKKAITYQTISVPIEKEEKVRALKIPYVEITDFRSRARPIKLGEHKGNDFEIIVRNVEQSESSISGKIERLKKDGIINYFGEQRFGSVKSTNDKIGKLLVLGNIEKAAKLIMKSDGNYERNMADYLKRSPKDFDGAIRQLPLRLLKLFVHAYQSRIWNKCATMYDDENTPIPIVGHKTDVRNFPRVRKIVENVLREEEIDPEDFGNRVYRELSSRGTERDYRVYLESLKYTLKEKRLTLKFYLPKGSYATEVIRQLAEA